MVTCLQQLHLAVWKLGTLAERITGDWSILKIECSSQHQLSSDPTGVLLKVSYYTCVVWRCLSAAAAGNLIPTSRHQMTPCPHQHMLLYSVHFLLQECLVTSPMKFQKIRGMRFMWLKCFLFPSEARSANGVRQNKEY